MRRAQLRDEKRNRAARAIDLSGQWVRSRVGVDNVIQRRSSVGGAAASDRHDARFQAASPEFAQKTPHLIESVLDGPCEEEQEKAGHAQELAGLKRINYRSFPDEMLDTCFAIAKAVVRCLLFSEERKQIESHIESQMRQDARDSIVRYIQQCRKQEVPVVVSNMNQIFWSKQKKNLYPRLYVSHPILLDRIVTYLATLCLHFFDNLLSVELPVKETAVSTRPSAAKEKPLSLTQFPVFCLGALWRFSLGWKLQGQTLLPRIMFLITFMPGINTIELFPLRFTKKNYTAIQKQILWRLNRILTLNLMPLSELRLPTLAFEREVICGIPKPVTKLYYETCLDWQRRGVGRALPLLPPEPTGNSD